MKRSNPSGIFSPDFPFAPAKLRYFYGWMVAAAGTLGIICSIPGQTMGVSVFTDHLIGSLQISRTSISTAYLIGTIASGFLVTPMGRWLDRYGIRRGAVAAGVGMFVALTLLSQVDRIAEVLSFGSEGAWDLVVRFLSVTVGFFLLRFFGQGLMTLTSRNMIAKWFDLFRGRVSAVSGIIASFGFSAAPLGLNGLIEFSGWRGAWILLSLFSGAFFIAFAWTFFRDNPEECGLEMDGGRTVKPGGRINKDNEVVRSFRKQEVLRTYSFWVYNVGLSFQAFFITGFTFHLLSVAKDVGISEPHILRAFLPASVLTVFVSLFIGWLIDRTRIKYSFLSFCFGLGLFPASLFFASGTLALGGLVLGLAICGGSFAPIMGTVWARFYGRESLGAISGFNMASMVIASALGPIVFSLSYELWGSYHAAIGLGIVGPLLFFIAGIFADNPQLKLQKEREEAGHA
ncbi:MAG: MFS transporter [Puniceicoccales bacterium]